MVNAALNSRPPRPKLRDLGIRVHEVPPSPFPICKEPLKVLTETHIRHLDPSGTRTRLFAPTNPERVCPGDILLVRQRSGDPFAGVVISIKRAGTDTAVLLRGQLTRVGVEMWFKVYSPNVVGMEVVKRAEKRARRARLTYLRKPEHDKGSVENVVRHYLKQRAALGSASANATLKKTSKR
ncbi:hypothetical protein P152DRAFT_457287 [Eremomyces bilateralis CBS 781.70]|uniref:Mitochondrial ribosomal protein-like protein n=1 Tax=Eremomyces bilateralis CBS 781.70 TaxID=1392243 RepID=A0A6G1G7P7_9PEZI|nr:uncharacterized protein P152DRAFT_457287 [Eremomyces bilateralis CBS 781.70]KAF1813910.1 hypothetical protein P152DRAFT_457287 [Eremomyces bilateralis CBS 781.70]